MFILRILIFLLILISSSFCKEIQVFEFTENEFSTLKVRKVNYFVLGHLLDNHHLFLCFLIKKNRSVLVDDGSVTPESFSRYKNLSYPNFIRKFIKFPSNLYFFTSYDLGKSKNIMKNEFNNLKRLNKLKKESDVTYFIGSRVYQRIGEKNHINILKKVYISPRVLPSDQKKTDKRVSKVLIYKNKYFKISSAKVDHCVDVANELLKYLNNK